MLLDNKQCQFKFEVVNVETMERLLISLPDDTSSGSDNIDSELLKAAAKFVSLPIHHIDVWHAAYFHRSGMNRKEFQFQKIRMLFLMVSVADLLV